MIIYGFCLNEGHSHTSRDDIFWLFSIIEHEHRFLVLRLSRRRETRSWYSGWGILSQSRTTWFSNAFPFGSGLRGYAVRDFEYHACFWKEEREDRHLLDRMIFLVAQPRDSKNMSKNLRYFGTETPHSIVECSFGKTPTRCCR